MVNRPLKPGRWSGSGLTRAWLYTRRSCHQDSFVFLWPGFLPRPLGLQKALSSGLPEDCQALKRLHIACLESWRVGEWGGQETVVRIIQSLRVISSGSNSLLAKSLGMLGAAQLDL